jgi:hypothetical protein
MEEIYMKLRKNIGELDSLVRLGLGFSMLGYGITKKSNFAILMGSWKIAEGITRVSIMYHLLGIDTLDDELNLSGTKELMLNPLENIAKVDDTE